MHINTVQMVILGLLSWKKSSGYDLKKAIAESTVWHWSGNNNQIYTTLTQLHREGLVEFETLAQATLPTKKIYSITAAGQERLREWVMSDPQLPELRNSFLVQLSWADRLSDSELADLLTRYEKEIEAQLVMHLETTRRAHDPNRTKRETLLWRSVADNVTRNLNGELNWVRDLRNELAKQ